MGDNEATTDPRFIVEIGSHRFDPKGEASRSRLQTTAGRKRLAKALGVEPPQVPGADRPTWLIQFTEDPEAAMVQRFRDDFGLRLSHGLSSNTFVERLDRNTVDTLRKHRAIRACIPYSPQLKLLTVGPTVEAASMRLEIGLIEGNDIDGVRSMLQQLGVSVLLVNDDTVSGGGLSLLVEAKEGADLLAVASIDDVLWVVPVGDLTVKNLDTAGIAQSGDAAVHPVWDQGLHGEKMTIGVIDAGEIDLLSKFLLDPGQAAASMTHRKVVDNRKAAGVNVPPDAAHPTKASGCAVADEDGNSGSHVNRGGAWGARIAYGDVFRVFGSSPSGSITAEFGAAGTAGARVHTNSWGIGSGGAAPTYDGTARDTDGFLFSNQDHLCLIAAPNPGGSFEGGLVIAKNPVLVGGVRASPNENSRRADPAPLTADGRRKPDLLGVAENVTTSDLTGGGVTPLAVTTRSGNSYTTPHVAAAAALLRQYFTEGWYPNGKKEPKNGFTPSGALLKAVLLNATVPLTGVASYPSARDGWGRLQLNKALHFDGDKLNLSVWDVRHVAGLNRDGSYKLFSLAVPANAKAMKITLVFTDPSGAVGAADPVVNKLDIEVMEPRSMFDFDFSTWFGYYGNDFQNKVSRRRNVFAVGANSPPDPSELKNNVRQVLVNAPAAGRWSVFVRAHKVDQVNTPSLFGPFRRRQGYALVACVEMN